jgi:serine/threonine-protein kinase
MPDGREDSPSTLGKGRVVVFGNTERPAATEPVVPCADDPLIGCILRDTYRIVASLDEGGMGKLYRAEHLRLRRPVAVKFMARTLVTNPEALARFRREAEIISQLEHPHIVHILDFDATTAGEPYIVMELLSGMTLTERMAESPSVPLREAVEIALQISSGLTLAHASGIVHRDLKPDNVFLLSMTDKRVFVKLLDFGISMGNAAAARLTGKFDVLGTPDYMAPEQALDSSRTDHRADQWSLACLVYEMLAGRPPFTGDSVVELLRNVVQENPRKWSRSSCVG